MDYHAINVAYESMLDRMWEDRGEWPEEDYDPYAEAEAMWEAREGR